MAWRVAESLQTLLRQVNELTPERDKKSDGSIGDAAHASRSSDHNPWVKEGRMGIVTARDFTHDMVGPHILDAHKLVEALKASGDPRIISNRRIWNPSVSPDWRAYKGSNPHTMHAHVSVKSDKAHYDDASPWDLSGYAAPTIMDVAKEAAVATPMVSMPLTKRRAKGEHVKRLQSLLNAKGADPKLTVDGKFGAKTEIEVRDFQKQEGLSADGIVGPYTWQALLES